MQTKAEVTENASLFGCVDLEEVSVGGEVIGYTAAKRGKSYFLALKTSGIPNQGTHKTRAQAAASFAPQATKEQPRQEKVAAVVSTEAMRAGLTENMVRTLVNLVAAGSVRAENPRIMNKIGCHLNSMVALQRRGLVELVENGETFFGRNGGTSPAKIWTPTEKGREVADSL